MNQNLDDIIGANFHYNSNDMHMSNSDFIIRCDDVDHRIKITFPHMMLIFLNTPFWGFVN